jgi:hypothetical protein
VTRRSLVLIDRFAPEANRMRRTFDDRFRDPRVARADRFVWDYWHVPGQYTQLRTPAWTYFSKNVYESFHRRLVAWGRRVLGCHDVSPPWLSCYVDGCGQHLHGDLPHGPWAFVFSLTRWNDRTFSGGETMLLRDGVLDFWSSFVSVRSIEESDVIESVEPRFNRLLVFDPRVPHGVRTVMGTRDPREGRLVVNGWFVQPRPFIEGSLRPRALEARVHDLTKAIGDFLAGRHLLVAGLLSVGFRVTRAGAVQGVRVLSDTTRAPASEESLRRRFVRAIVELVSRWSFGAQAGPSRVTLPVVFERD